MFWVSFAHKASGSIVGTGHSRTVLSRLPVTIVRLSGLNAMLLTAAVCPVRAGPKSPPVCAFHRWTVPSLLAAMVVPSGLNAAAGTMPPAKTRGSPLGCRVCASQIGTVLWKLPATMRCPSGLNDSC